MAAAVGQWKGATSSLERAGVGGGSLSHVLLDAAGRMHDR